MGIVVVVTAMLTGVITRDIKRCLWFSLAPLPGLVLAEQWSIRQSQRRQAQWQCSLQETIQHQEARLLELEYYEGQLNQAIAVAEQVNQGLQADNQSLKSERFLLGQQLSGLKYRWDKLNLQFAALKPQKRRLEQELAALTQVVKQTDHHKQTIEKNLQDSFQQLQQIEHSCHAIQGEVVHLVGEIRALTAQKQQLNREISEKNAQKGEIEACINHLHYEYDQLQGEIADINCHSLAQGLGDLWEIAEDLTPSGLS